MLLIGTALQGGDVFGHEVVVASAALVIVLMLIAWSLMIEWPSSAGFPRLIWSLGLIALIAHIILAFWLAHGWSHEAAVAHVREVGGLGSGIVVNYSVAVIWGFDVGWWWLKSSSRGQRPAWMGWAIHGFLLFVAINATVVFGTGERRLIYALMFVILAARFGMKRFEEQQ